MSSSLKQQAISGMIWSGIQRFGTMGVSFISNIILARMLTPDDYGCIGMLTIFIALSNIFIDGGFGSALIQKTHPTNKDYSTTFYWNIFLSIILYIILFLSAPLIARFYNIELLSDVLKVEGIILIINAFGIIQNNQLRKQLKFKIIAKVTLIASLISVVVAIFMAYRGLGVWSLVVQQIVLSSVSTLLYWVYNDWRPSLSFSWISFKELFGFGSYMFMSSLLNTFCYNLNGLLIGKYFSASTMGYYTQSKKIEDVFSSSIQSVVNQVSYPVLVEVKENFCQLKNMLSQINSMLLYIITPLMLLLNLLAIPVIILLLGEKWLPAVPYLKILVFQGIAVSIQNVNYNAVASVGRSRTLFTSTIVKRIFAIITMVVGITLAGIEGLLWGMVVSAFFVLFYNAIMVHKYIGYKICEQFSDLLPIVIVNIISYLCSYCIQLFVCIDGPLLYIIMFMTYIVSYLILSYIFKVKSLFFVFTVLKDMLRKVSNNS